MTGAIEPQAPDGATPTLRRVHWQRLRRMYRSAGWPFLDNVEIDLLAAGLLERVTPAAGGEYLRVTDAGLGALSRHLDRNRRARDAHEALATQVAESLARDGRLAYRELALRARPADRWLLVRPDVYSIRATTVADYLLPVVHEIKVRRADLRADLSKPDKRAGYLEVATQCYYVLAPGVADPEEIPAECGVIVAGDQRLETVRHAPARAMMPDFGTWMALARTAPVRPLQGPEPML